jgi:DNA repair protein RecO (recombination protein O)
VVLRSIRFGEADRVLHLYTAERGRINAIAKGVRRTGSRFGARLEPLTLVDLQLHEGRGELLTVSGADIARSHAAVRARPARLAVGLIGAEATMRLFAEPEPQPRVFAGLCRFLEVLEGHDPAGDPSLDPLGLAFQLKLLTLAGYQPHLESCALCGAAGPLQRFAPAAGGAVCDGCAAGGDGFALPPAALADLPRLVSAPLEAGAPAPAAAAAVLRVVESSYAHHGGFRMRTLAAG